MFSLVVGSSGDTEWEGEGKGKKRKRERGNVAFCHRGGKSGRSLGEKEIEKKKRLGGESIPVGRVNAPLLNERKKLCALCML